MGDEENLNGVPRRGAEAREEGAGRSDLENNSRLILINFVIDFFFSFFLSHNFRSNFVASS